MSIELCYQLILSKGTENDIRQIRDDLKTADSSIFGPIGPTVKESIENSDSCIAYRSIGGSACEVPDFEFLSEESSDSDESGALQHLQVLKAQNKNQLLECSVGCQQSKTLDQKVAQQITKEVLQNIANLGVGGDDDGDAGWVTNFNTLTQEELA